MVRDPGAAPARQAEGALELGAAGEHVAPGRHRQREQARDGAARAAQRQRPAAGDAQHRVVDARLDRPVVRDDEVGDRGEPLERVVVLVGDRLVGHVAARHHQRLAHVGEQQVMERAVREHHAELGRPRRHRPRHRARRGAGAPARSAGRARSAAPPRPAPAPPAPAPPPRRPPSARTASPRGACAPAAARPPPRRAPRHARWYPPIPLTATIARPQRAQRRRFVVSSACSQRGDPMLGRRRGRRWAGRGSGGSRGRRTRPRRRRTS